MDIGAPALGWVYPSTLACRNCDSGRSTCNDFD